MFKFSINEKKSFFVKYLYLLLTKISLLSSDLYTVSSKNDLDFLSSKFNKNSVKNIQIRPNWVYLSNKENINNRDRNSILNVGRLEYQKNQSEIIKAISNTNFNLTIYGEGSLKNELQNLAESLNVRVKIYNIIQNEQLLKIYKNFRYFILSSIFEGNPKVLLEAMSAGCIVITRDIPNNREIVNNGKNGYLYKNLNELKIILKNVDSDEKKHNNISNSAIKTIEKNYSILKCTNLEIKDLYSLHL
jgi:glycosyltransferase involved in cell wall biosynthesis